MNNRFWAHFDFVILFLVGLLLIAGCLAVYSATHTAEAQSAQYFDKHLTFAIIGLLLMLAGPFIPFRILERAAYPFYGLSLLLLVIVIFFGVKGFGAERWLAIGQLRIQPSEIAKLATIMAIARYLSKRDAHVNQFKDFIVVCGFIVVPFVLIIGQPDLGTSLVYAAILIPLLFWAGLRWYALLLIISPALTALASFNLLALIIWLIVLAVVLYLARTKLILLATIIALQIGVGLVTPILWDELEPYQKSRIITFVNPEEDPRGAGYQIIQSQVAIGSGGTWGKGFLNGTQTHLKFLPAQHTDFIFSVIGEEWGFFGVLTILTLFLLLLLYLINLAGSVRSPFSSIALIGIISILFFHIFVNIGMTVGLAPVTGLPLPFISYGGSFMISVMLMMALAQNFSYNRFLL